MANSLPWCDLEHDTQNSRGGIVGRQSLAAKKPPAQVPGAAQAAPERSRDSARSAQPPKIPCISASSVVNPPRYAGLQACRYESTTRVSVRRQSTPARRSGEVTDVQARQRRHQLLK